MTDLIERLNGFTNSHIFRGNASAKWTLESTLERESGKRFTREFVTNYEKYSKCIFSSKFHLYDRENQEPKSSLAWLAIMQHYGVPTRLLDFTTSPYAALYFAAEATTVTQTDDMAVIAMDHSAIMEASLAHIKAQDRKFTHTNDDLMMEPDLKDKVFEEIIERFNYDVLWVTEPARLNKRIDNQNGCFLVSANREKKIFDVLGTSIYKNSGSQKLEIPIRLYDNVICLLRKMNISAQTIYGDLQGLSRSLRVDLRVYST